MAGPKCLGVCLLSFILAEKSTPVTQWSLGVGRPQQNQDLGGPDVDGNDILYQWTKSSLAQEDLNKIHDLSMTVIDPHSAALKNGHFDVEANLDQRVPPPIDLPEGLIQGELKFSMEEPPKVPLYVEGIWISLNKTSNDTDSKGVFRSAVEEIRAFREGNNTIELTTNKALRRRWWG